MGRYFERGSVIAANIIALLAFFLGPENPLISKETRLAYAISPSPIVVADPAQTPKIKITLDAVEQKAKIVATRIILFNEGAKPIGAPDFNQPDGVIIQTRPPIRIIDIAVEESHPRVNLFSLDREKLLSGAAGVRWKLLRGNEGARLTFFYAGSTPVQFALDHSLSTQQDLIRIITDPAEKKREIRLRVPVILGVALVSFFVFLGMLYATVKRRDGLMVAYAITFFTVTAGAIWLIVHIAVTPTMPFTL